MTLNPLHGRLLAPADGLRFVVEFAQGDLAHASKRELRHAAWGVQLLVNRETPGHWEEKARPDLAFLQEVQGRARALLEQIVRGPVAIEGDLVLAFLLTRDAEGRVRGIVRGSPLDCFLYQVVRVLETGGAENLRACPAPECGRIFLKVTKKRFCSPRCQSRIYMRKTRADEKAERERLQPKGKKGSGHGKTTGAR